MIDTTALKGRLADSQRMTGLAGRLAGSPDLSQKTRNAVMGEAIKSARTAGAQQDSLNKARKAGGFAGEAAARATLRKRK